MITRRRALRQEIQTFDNWFNLPHTDDQGRQLGGEHHPSELCPGYKAGLISESVLQLWRGAKWHLFKRAMAGVGIGSVVAAGAVSFGMVIAIPGERDIDRAHKTYISSVNSLLIDKKTQRELGLCADELQAEADLRSFALEHPQSGYPTVPRPDRYKWAAQIAQADGAPCSVPLGGSGFRRNVVAGAQIVLGPSDFTIFDVDTICRELVVSSEAEMLVNSLRRRVAHSQGVQCPA